ncbi:MAG: C39 family peptidase [Planctomycetes bacterium]|nr:C39 family peptidase [Planctomycetota bacterium]
MSQDESLGGPLGPTWELSGLRWRPGRHGGTLVGAQGLELVPGVSRGTYQRTLDAPTHAFTHLVASLAPAPFPVGAALRLTLRAKLASGWSRWCSLGIVGDGRGFPASESSAPLAGEPHVEADLWTSPEPVREAQIRIEVEAGELGGSPRLRRLALEAWDPGAPQPAPSEPNRGAWGVEIAIPTFSQRAQPGDLVERGCSPTSLAMVLCGLGREHTVPDVAERVFDHGAEIYGNWSLNLAFAGELGLQATVRRATSLRFLEDEVAQGRAVIVSHKFGPGELPESPLPETQGHLLVVVGFSPEGDVVVHDPAAKTEIRRVYPRRPFATSWLERAAGIAYRILPLNGSTRS